jgi:hypothetical protein
MTVAGKDLMYDKHEKTKDKWKLYIFDLGLHK